MGLREHERLGVNKTPTAPEGEGQYSTDTRPMGMMPPPNHIVDAVVDSAIQKLQRRINAIMELRDALPRNPTHAQADSLAVVVADMTRLL